MAKKKVLWTHDEAAVIMDIFEDFLEAHGITIPSPEDDEKAPDNGAILYGSVYSVLADQVEACLTTWLKENSIPYKEGVISDTKQIETSPGIYVICYGKKKIWTDRDAAIAFYRDCVNNSEGCERDRYANILFDLWAGNRICYDGK